MKKNLFTTLIVCLLVSVKTFANNEQTFLNGYVGGIGGNFKIGKINYEKSSLLEIKVVSIPQENSNKQISLCFLMNESIIILDERKKQDKVVNGPCQNNLEGHPGVYWISLDNAHTRWFNDEANEAYSPSLDAFFAATKIKSMFIDWFKISPMIDQNGNPKKITIRTHFAGEGSIFDADSIILGDGDKIYYPMTEPEVIAHEIGHHFMDNYSRLPWNPQIAALGESFADMTAMALQYYLTGTNNWIVSLPSIKPGMQNNDGAIRYLDNPKKDGHSIDHTKDFDKSLNEHYAAGITNKAFYLLATTHRWNTKKAYEVFARANMIYWRKTTSNFTDIACGVISATKDYTYEVEDVRLAFTQVGIDTHACH